MLDPHMHRNALYPHVHPCIADALYLDVHPQFLVASASVEWIGGGGCLRRDKMCMCVQCIVHCITVVMSMLGGIVGSWEGPVEMLKDNIGGGVELH